MKDASDNYYWSASFLLLLIAADFSFIGLQILHSWGYAGDPRFSLGAERGYAEVYQYVKFFWTAFILGWFTLEKREAVYVVGMLLFLYLLFDDSLTIHETVGGSLVDLFSLPSAFGLRGQDFGELGVSAMAGIFFLASGWVAYRHSGAFARRVGFYLLAGVFALAIFGVGMDLAHQLLASRFSWIDTPLVVLEDGGELIVVSAISWFIYSLADQELTFLQVYSPLESGDRSALRIKGED
jgi:hypothetical protein